MTIADLIPVIVGAAAGVAGGIGASIHAQYRQSKREIHKELRANLLTVILEVSKIGAWLEKEQHYYVGSSAKNIRADAIKNPPAKIEPDPMQKIQAIVSLYFPGILEYARELTTAGLRHRVAARKLSLLTDEESGIDSTVGDVNEQYGKMKNALADALEKQKRLEKAAQELMAKLLNEKS